MTIRIPKKASTIVDKLGEIKARVSALQKEEKALREALVETGLTEVNGKLFRATVSMHSPAARTNWRAVADEFEIPQSVIANHTTIGKPSVQVKVVAQISEQEG